MLSISRKREYRKQNIKYLLWICNIKPLIISQPIPLSETEFLMRKLSFVAVFLSAFSCQADLLTAVQAYEKQDFHKATQEFGALLPLANEQAAFNLGAMAYNAEGQPRDLVKAQAYFDFAAAREHQEAKTLADKIRPTLSAAQQKQAADLLAQLKQQVIVKPRDEMAATTSSDDARAPVRRFPPEYPKKAAQKGMFGSVAMRLLINEKGDVDAVDVLNAYPKGVFERDAIRALKRWKYTPGDRKTIGRVMLTFSLGEIDHKKVQVIFDEHKLWQYSALGSPQHQNAVASVLQIVRTNSDFSQFVDKSLPPVLGPIDKNFVASAKLVTNDLLLPADYDLNAFVTLNDQGVVTAVHDSDAKYLQKINAALLNRQITKADVPAGFYRLSAYDKKNQRLLTAQRIPQTYTDEYWMEQAARNGNLDAQRALAALRSEWEMYLLEQQDPVVQSWAGTRLVLDGKKAEGEKLLDAAIAKGHDTAKELKAAL